MIPRAAAEATAKKHFEDWNVVNGSNKKWAELPESWREEYITAMATAMQVGIDAWPGMTAKQHNEHVALFHADPAIILPLPQQEGDA